MKKEFNLAIALILILGFGFISAHGEETFSQAEEIIKQKIPCDNLTIEELEILGDYYMEQMHPGEQHEIMDEMMGGEGSEGLRQIHINMGLSFYCGEHDSMSENIMDMMMGRTETMDSGNMMGNFETYGIFQGLFILLIIFVLVLLIIWLINQLQNKKRKRR